MPAACARCCAISQTPITLAEGRNIQIDVNFNGGFCDSECLSRAVADTGGKVPSPVHVQCFAAALRGLNNQFKLEDGILTDATNSSAGPKFLLAVQHNCINSQTNGGVRRAPVKHHDVNVTRPGLAVLQACYNEDSQAGPLLECLTLGGACFLPAGEMQQLVATAASKASAETTCSYLNTCKHMLDDATAVSASCPAPERRTMTVSESFPHKNLGLRFVGAGPPGLRHPEEYLNPWDDVRDTPLVDARDATEKWLSDSFGVSDVLSRYDAGVPQLVVRPEGELFNRNRFFRADGRLLRCLESVASLVPISIVRWYETRTEALERGDVLSRHRSGSRVAIAHPSGNSPARTLELADLVVQQCSAGVRAVPTLTVGLGLSQFHLTVDFQDVHILRNEMYFTWVQPDAPLTAAEFQRWVAAKETNDERVMPNLVCDAELIADVVLPRKLSPFFSSGRKHNDGLLSANTEFCTQSAQSRKDQFIRMWSIVEAQHNTLDNPVVSNKQLRTVAQQCALTCDGGDIFGENRGPAAVLKADACDEFVHWLPYKIFTDVDSCHINVQGSERMRDAACFWGQCLARTSLFAVISNLFTGTWYLPEPGATATPLYGAQNPSPVFTQLSVAYSMHCTGRVTVWAEGVAEVGDHARLKNRSPRAIRDILFRVLSH